jgi:hypothetical protein
VRSIAEFLTEDLSASSITDLYVDANFVEFRYNEVPFAVNFSEISDTKFPFTKRNFKSAMGEVEYLIKKEVGNIIKTDPNWAETMSEITRRIEALFINTNNKITEVLINEFDVMLACDGKAVSFNLIRYEDEPFPSEEAAIAFVEGQLKPFKGARNYKKIFDKIMLVMDDNHYWESDED